MAISGKLRYEILRRDRYTCRFCGASAPDVPIVIDHVIPRSQGGPDVAENLQALCEECNLGKSSTMPERWLVAEVKKAARLWAGNRHQPAPDDDYAEMYAYMDAYDFLESRPSQEVLRACTRVWADIYPYRPTSDELLIAAAKVIREAPAPTGVPF